MGLPYPEEQASIGPSTRHYGYIQEPENSSGDPCNSAKWQQHQEGVWEVEEVPRPEGRTREVVESKGQSGSNHGRLTQGCDS